MLNPYTKQAGLEFPIQNTNTDLNTTASYGYHTRVQSECNGSIIFEFSIKEYNEFVEFSINFHGTTPNGSAGPHGFNLNLEKVGYWYQKSVEIFNKVLQFNFEDFSNPQQHNRSISITSGEESNKYWSADCGSPQSFAKKCFEINKYETFAGEVKWVNCWSHIDEYHAPSWSLIFYTKIPSLSSGWEELAQMYNVEVTK